MNTMSWIIIVFILICMVLGYRRGFVRSILKIVFTVLSLLLAYFLAPLVGNILMVKTQIDDSVEKKIYSIIEREAEKQVEQELDGTLGEFMTEDMKESLVDAVLNQEPDAEQQQEIISSLESPQFIKDILIANNNQETKSQLGVKNFYKYVSSYIAYMVTNAIAFMMTFAGMIILFNIIMLIANVATSLPIINSINRLAGMVLGGIEAILIVWIFFAIIKMLADTNIGADLNQQINESLFLQFINKYNIFNSIIKSFAKV